jgi:O-antigen/teichoic acid export membrane protein
MLLSSSFCARFLVLVFNILIARYLGVEQFGIYAFATSFVTLLSVLVEFSLQQLIIRDVARNPDLAGSYFSNALALKCLFFLFAFALLPITIKLLGYSQQIQTVVYILSIGLLFDAVTNCCVAIFNAMQQMRYSGALGIIEEVCFTMLGLATLALGGGLTAIVICRVLAQAATQLTGLFFLTRKLFVRPGVVHYSVCKRLMEHGLTFFGVSVFTAAARNLDTVLLLSMQGAAAVGIYAAAAKLVKVTSYFSRAFSDALYPELSKRAASQDRKLLGETYGQSMKWLMITVVPFVAFAMVQSAGIMRTLYGPDFVEASVVFVIFAWRAALGFFTQFCGTALYALGRQRLVFKATGAGLIISLMLFAILIPRYSYTGAAFAVLGALVIEFLLQLPSVHHRLKSGSINVFVLKPLAAGMAMALFCAFFNYIPLTPLAGLGLLVYGGCLVIVGAISLEELMSVLRSPMTLLQRKTVREV